MRPGRFPLRPSDLLPSGLRARIVLLALLAALPGIVVGFVSAQRTHAREERDARDEAVRTAQLAAFGGREFLYGARTFLRTLAELPVVQRAMSPRCAALARELAAVLRPAYADLGVAAPNGDVVCSASAQAGVRSIVAETWFTRALRDGVFTVGTFRGSAPGRGTIGLGYPVRRSGSVVGVAFARLWGEAVQGVLEEAYLPPGGAILVLDSRGSAVAARPRGVVAGLPILTAPFQTLLPLPAQQFERRDADGERRLYALAQVGEPGNGLLLAVGVPAESGGDVLATALFAVSLSGFLGLGLAFAAAGRLVLRPVSALSSAAARIAQGDLSARSGVAGAAGEVGDLARVFDEMAESLEEQTRYLRAIFDRSLDAIQVLDDERRYLDTNPAGAAMLGVSPERLLAMRVDDFVPPESKGTLDELWRDFLKRGELVGELEAVRPDGSRWIAEFSGTANFLPGRHLFAARDVTARRRAEEELRRSLVKVREAEAARRELLSRFARAQEREREQIATDLREDSLQALTALTLRLGLLRRQVERPQALETLETVEEIVRDVLARLSRLTDRLRPPALDRDGLAATLRAHLGEVAGGRGIEWSLDNRLPGEPRAETRAMVYAIAQEAIENAVRHSGPSRIDVALERFEGGVRARVRDDGAGFAMAESPGLADVGLEWMRARAETAGGWLRIESAAGKGTTVEFFVPELPGEQEPAG